MARPVESAWAEEPLMFVLEDAVVDAVAVAVVVVVVVVVSIAFLTRGCILGTMRCFGVV